MRRPTVPCPHRLAPYRPHPVLLLPPRPPPVLPPPPPPHLSQSLERQIGTVHSSSQVIDEDRRSVSRRAQELEIGGSLAQQPAVDSLGQPVSFCPPLVDGIEVRWINCGAPCVLSYVPPPPPPLQPCGRAKRLPFEPPLPWPSVRRCGAVCRTPWRRSDRHALTQRGRAAMCR